MFHLLSISNRLRKNIKTLASMCAPFLLVGTAAALLSVVGPDAGRRSQTTAVRLTPMALHHHNPRQVHQKLDDSTYTSVNWTGYAVTGGQGSVTDVKASWVVPPVNCSTTSADVPNVFASFWTGIDGWTSSTVEQIGTDSDCQDYEGKPTANGYYYAWFEFYPQESYYIGTPANGFAGNVVVPGDTISAEVTYTGTTSGGPRRSVSGGFRQSGSQQFTVTITDETRVPTWTFTYKSSVRGAQQSSAEWIAETPYGCSTRSGYCYLPNFVSTQYTGSATVNGATGHIGSFGNSVQQSIMVDANAPNNDIPASDIMAEPNPSCPAYPATLMTGRRGNLCSSSGDISDLGGSTGSGFAIQYYNAGP